MSTPWPTTTIGELFNVGAGKSVTPTARQGERRHPFLRTANVLWGRVDLTALDAMHFSDEEIAAKELKKGDLLVCEGGDIGRAAIWNGEVEKCGFQNHIHRLRPQADDVVPRFFMYYLQSGFTQLGIYEGAGNKTTIPNLSRGRLEALEVPKPPRPEQEKIAAVLWKIQRAIEVEEKLIATARELKQAAMRQLFTHGLRGETQKETDIGPIPESWQVVTLGELGRIGNGSTPKRTNPAYWENGRIPWLTSGKIYEGVITKADEHVTELAAKECHLPVVKNGSVIIAITGQGKTLGNAAVVALDTCISQHLAYVQFERADVDPHFVRMFMQSRYDHLRQIGQGGGSTKGALTCGFLKSYPIPLPPLAEQNEIAGILQTIDRKIAVHERKRATLQELFQTMLHQLMTAQLRVHTLALDVSEVQA